MLLSSGGTTVEIARGLGRLFRRTSFPAEVERAGYDVKEKLSASRSGVSEIKICPKAILVGRKFPFSENFFLQLRKLRKCLALNANLSGNAL